MDKRRLDNAVNNGLTEVKKIRNKRVINKLNYSLSSVFVLAGALVILGVTNPALAKSIPIVGSVFSALEEKGIISGNKSYRSITLTEDAVFEINEKNESSEVSESLNQLEDKEEPVNTDVTDNVKTEMMILNDNIIEAEDQGLSIKATEVYSDGASMYLGVEIMSDDLGTIQHYIDYKEDGTEGLFQLVQSFSSELSITSFDENGEIISASSKKLGDIEIIGYQEEDGRFIGEMEIPFDRIEGVGSSAYDTVELNINNISADIEDDENIESLEDSLLNSFWLDGEWKLKISFVVDGELTKQYVVDDLDETTGFGINYIKKTPEKLILDIYCPGYDNETGLMTKEYFDEVFAPKFEGSIKSEPDYETDKITSSEDFERIVIVEDNGHVQSDIYSYYGTAGYYYTEGRDVGNITLYFLDNTIMELSQNDAPIEMIDEYCDLFSPREITEDYFEKLAEKSVYSINVNLD